MSKILITGGLGNLGSWLTEHFVNAGNEVWVVTKNFRNIDIKVKFHLIQCDIADYANCKLKLSELNFDYIIHTGSVNDGFVDGYAKLALEVNTLGTRNLLEIFKDRPAKNFIYFSTFQVYGKYEGRIDENTEVSPKNDYGSTHLFAEFYIKQFWHTHKIPHTIIRLTNSYGCPKDHNSSKWYLILNDLSKTAFEKKEIVLKSNGLAPRDFIWMGDVCKIIENLFKTEATNETYNLSGEKTYRMIDLAKFVKEAYFEKFKVEIPIKVNEKDTVTYSDSLFVDATKLKNVVPYTSESHFKEEALRIFEFLKK